MYNRNYQFVKIILTAVSIAFGSVFPLNAETFLGGVWEGIYQPRLPDREPVSSMSSILSQEFRLQMSAYAADFTFFSDIAFNHTVGNDHDPQNVQVSIDLLEAELYLTPTFIVKAGKFTSSLGSAYLFSPLQFMHAADMAAIFKGSAGQVLAPDELLQLSLLTGNIITRLTIDPFHTLPATVDPQSEWFPANQFPRVFETAGGSEKTLGSISYESYDPPPQGFDDFGLQLDISGTAGLLDWGLVGYYGYDPQTAYQVHVDVQNSSDEFTILLKPIPGKIAAIGSSLTAVWDSLTIYGDLAFTWGKILGTDWLKLAGSLLVFEATQTMAEAPLFSYAAGAVLDVPEISSLLILEVTDKVILADDASIQKPLFSRLFSGILHTDLLDYTASAQTILLLSLEDGSGVIYPQFSWLPSAEFSLSAAIPFFWGNYSDEFGQYGRVFRAVISGTLRF